MNKCKPLAFKGIIFHKDTDFRVLLAPFKGR